MLFLRCSPLPVLGFDGETLISGSHIEDTCTQRFVQPARSHRLCSAIWQHRERVNPARIIAFRSIDLFVAIVAVIPDELFQGRQVNRQAFIVDLFKCAKRHSQSANQTCPIAAEAVSSHWQTLSCPLMSTMVARVRNPHVQQRWTVRKLLPSMYCDRLFWFSSNSNSKGEKSIFSAISALPSARAVIQACCDLKFWVIPSSCSCSWQKLPSLIVATTASFQEREIWRNIDDTWGCRCCILYNKIALTQVSDTSIFKRVLALRNTVWEIVVFALRSKRETVCVSNHVSHRKLLVVLVQCCLLLWREYRSLRLVETLFRKTWRYRVLLCQPTIVATQSSWLRLLPGR